MRVVDFFEAGGHFGLGAAIDERGGAGAETARGADCVHGGVAATDDNHVAIAAIVDGLVDIGIGAHEIDAGEELVGGVDAVEVLAGNAEEDGQAGAGGDEDRVEVLVVHQLVDGDAFADDDVGFKLDAHAAQVVDFALDDGLGQTKLRNAVDEHAAELVERFKDADAMALLDEISCGGETGGTAADDGDVFAGGRARWRAGQAGRSWRS